MLHSTLNSACEQDLQKSPRLNGISGCIHLRNTSSDQTLLTSVLVTKRTGTMAIIGCSFGSGRRWTGRPGWRAYAGRAPHLRATGPALPHGPEPAFGGTFPRPT